MPSMTALRAADERVGSNRVKTSVIKVKFSGEKRGEVEEKIKEAELSSGYRSLLRNETLAGRQAAKALQDEDGDVTTSRLRMVKRLRQKESWLIWKEFFRDLDHGVGVLFQRLNPSVWMKDLRDSL